MLQDQASRASARRGALLVRPIGRELAIEHVTGGDRTLTMILGKPAPPRHCSQTLRAHEPFDPVQAAGFPIGQQVVPDTARTIDAIASYMAGTDLRTDHLVVAGTLRRRADQPGMEAASRNSERRALPCHRPDPSVLRDELESLAGPKAAVGQLGGGFFRMSRSAFNLASSRRRRSISICSGFI